MVRLAYSYDDDQPNNGSANIRWNSIGLVGRQSLVLVFSLLIARMIGPASYGVVAQANVYIALTTLILDQGISTALVSTRTINRAVVGAASAVNLLLCLLLILITILLAPFIADFFQMPELEWVLIALGIGLLFKAICIVPRMLLTRRTLFKHIATAEVSSAFIGGVAGTLMAIMGYGTASIVAQVIVMDFVATCYMYAVAKPPAPNLRLMELKDTLGFSARVFVANIVSFSSRNTDSILIGRYLGATALAQYSLSYRILLTPIQMVGQTVTRVLHPVIARSSSDMAEVRRLIVKSITGISILVFPSMAFISVASGDGISLILGNEWQPAAPVIAVLAITGARQTISAINAPVLLGLSASKLHLRFNLVSACVQILGVVVGLPWGILGVAVGYTVAGFLLMPLVLWLQAHLTGLSIRSQLACIWPATHASLWAVAPYCCLLLVDISEFLRLSLGLFAGVCVYLLMLRLFHHPSFSFLNGVAKDLFSRTSFRS